MIRSKDIIDEYDKRIRLISKEVTFPLDDKTKKVIKDSLEMLFSWIEVDLKLQKGQEKPDDFWFYSLTKFAKNGIMYMTNQGNDVTNLLNKIS